MELKELRKKYGYSLQLLQEARKNFETGNNNWDECLTAAITNYATSKKERPLRAKTYGVAKVKDKIAVIELKTETLSRAWQNDFVALANKLAEQVLKNGTEQDFEHQINLMIAQYGENIGLGELHILELKNEKVTIYNHRGRFVSIVTFFTPGGQGVLQKAHIIALNALRYYQNFLYEANKKNAPKNNDYKSFLGLKPVFGISSYTSKIFGQYLRLLPEISIDDITIFGY